MLQHTHRFIGLETEEESSFRDADGRIGVKLLHTSGGADTSQWLQCALAPLDSHSRGPEDSVRFALKVISVA